MASVADLHGAPSELRGSYSSGKGANTREKKRRRRTRPHEVDVLMSAYLQNAFPNEATRERLAKSVGMTPRAVSVWFQNRRQAEKKRSQRYGGCDAQPTSYEFQRMPLQTLDLAHLHGLRDLHGLVGPLAIGDRQASIQRSTSSPCVSLTTNAQGHAQLGHAEKLNPRCDSAIWQRMESSSGLSSCSDIDDLEPQIWQDEDEEEITLRRIAQKRARRRGPPDASDARQMLQTQASGRPNLAPRPLKRQASLSLEFAAARELSPELGASKPLRRTESMPVRTALRHLDNNRPQVTNSVPASISRKPLSLLGTLRKNVQQENQPIKTFNARAPSSLRRVASTGSRVPPRSCALWPWTPSVPVTRRESSARSDKCLTLTPFPSKIEEHDDSGFFEEESQPQSSPEASALTKLKPMERFTEHDRQAVELLLGLGSVSTDNT
ncbi:hypothetical protein MYAM1_001182 [Malassezia yamatoensis]|uniref:Homeobox domain-containing protein n=1 Tax=Malassezia yamatoensis TaxID=253288 RepID=A0AAJ5YXV5_9BASI|nr:hypothetical protein MYAM1_001182 [Malassezia yamatoensis]